MFLPKPFLKMHAWLGARVSASPHLPALLVFGVALIVYLRTLAPSITWEHHGADSGDLVAAAFTSGVPHPPGYPFYTLLAQIFIALPIGSIAYRVNVFSATTAALAVAVLYLVGYVLLAENQPLRRVIAAASALFFAFSPLFWSQATIAEVYALNALLTVILFGGFLLWSGILESTGARLRLLGRWSVAIALGVGLAHHPTILFMLPAGFVLLWRRVDLRAIAHVLLVSILAAALLDLTLVLRAWGDPPINWGDPRTLGDLWWVISAQVYRTDLLGLPWAAYPARFSAWANLLFDQFGTFGVVLALWGNVEIVRWHRRIGSALVLTFILYSLFALGYTTADSEVYLIPALWVATLWIATALPTLVSEVTRYVQRRGWTGQAVGKALVIAMFLLPVANGVVNLPGADLSQDTEALAYGREVLASLPNDALVIAEGDKPIMALWYCRYVERPESRVMIIAPGLLVYPWYREQLRRHYPDWVWPSRSVERWDEFLQILIAENLEHHAVFWTEPAPQFMQVFDFRPVGLVQQVLARGP